jgi:hypothetical protein
VAAVGHKVGNLRFPDVERPQRRFAVEIFATAMGSHPVSWNLWRRRCIALVFGRIMNISAARLRAAIVGQYDPICSPTLGGQRLP